MAVVLDRGGLMSVGTPKQRAGSILKTPNARSSRGSSSSSSRRREAERKARESVAAKQEAERKAREKKVAEEIATAEKIRKDMVIARRNQDRSLEAAKAVELREQLTRIATERGRPFTQSEARSFLGGGAGIKALRAGASAERSYFKKTGISLQQERERLRKQAQLMKGVSVSKIIAERLPSNREGYIRVRLPNGKIEEVRSSGRFNFGNSYAGKKVVVKDGQIIQVGDDAVKGVKVGNVDLYVRSKQGVVSEFTRLAPATASVNNFRDKLRAKKIRGDINSAEELALIVGGFIGGALASLSGVLDLPQAAIGFILNPSRVKQIIPSIQRSGETFGQVLWLSPGEAFANIAGQYYGLKGSNAAIRSVSRLSSNVLTRLNPKFTGKAIVGKTLNVKVAPGRTVRLKVVGKIPKQTLAKQVSMAGQRVNAVSSQADDLFKLLRRRQVVRKPIPGQANFNAVTKNLLKKFDSRTITKTELYKLDTMLRSQGAKGILERSFFADPSGMVRPSRLGITKDKGLSFSDYMSSEITFKKAKPAIYIFDDLKISKYPARIKPIVQKMKQGKTLSPKEFTTYAKWHASPSGNAKAVGFATKESEILLSPGEILKKRGVVGYTLVNGKRVKIVRVGLYKPTGTTQTLITKLKQGKITPAERVKLTRTLRKQTGLNYGSPSSASARARYVSITKVGYNTLSRYIKTGRKSIGVSGKRTSGKLSRMTTSGKKPVRRASSPMKTSKTIKKGTSRTSPRTTSRPSSPISPTRTSKARGGSSPRRIVKKKVIVTRIQLPKGFTKKKLSKPTPAYYVIVKRRGKWVKLMAKPLIKKDARDYLAYSLDSGLERSAFFVPVGKAKVTAKLPRKMVGYYSRTTRKFRPYRIRLGKKKQLLNGYIEKSKYAMDTRREQLQLQRLRAKKRTTKRKTTTKRRPTKRVVKRKSPTKRKKR